MSALVLLTVTQGNLEQKAFVFHHRTQCLVGRANDCNLRLPCGAEHQNISRHHCLLDIDPPAIRVRDSGSLNGTYVNGEKIGQRQGHQSAEAAALLDAPAYPLREGDELGVGDLVFQVQIVGATDGTPHSERLGRGKDDKVTR